MIKELLFRVRSRSKSYRVILIIALTYTVLRLLLHGGYMVAALLYSQEMISDVPGTQGIEEPMISADFDVYLKAATHLQMRQDLYLKGPLDRVEFYQYSPAYALAFVPSTWVPLAANVVIHSLLHIIAYGLLYWQWDRIFQQLGLEQAREMMVRTLPIWLVFSQFWGDMGYLNIYIFMALLATLLIKTILNEQLWPAVLWLSIILQTKPQWAFAVAVPLLLGRWRFFAKLLVTAILAYGAVFGLMMLVLGPSYVWRQYSDYFQFLWNMPADFPWRGPDAPFLGYNHSITQIVIYLLGARPTTLWLARGIKVLLLIPLTVLSIRYLLHSPRLANSNTPQMNLDWAFALYTAAFIWLDMVWELTLGILVFTYMLATSARRSTRIVIRGIFLPYALQDAWQVISFAVFGSSIILPGFYIAVDPAIYIPIIMIVILTFHALLVKRLWTKNPPLITQK